MEKRTSSIRRAYYGDDDSSFCMECLGSILCPTNRIEPGSLSSAKHLMYFIININILTRIITDDLDGCASKDTSSSTK